MLTKNERAAFSIGHFGSGLALAFDPASPHTVATSSIDQTVNVWTNLGQRIAYSFCAYLCSHRCNIFVVNLLFSLAKQVVLFDSCATVDIPSAVDARVTALRRQHWAREDPVSGAEVANSLAVRAYSHRGIEFVCGLTFGFSIIRQDVCLRLDAALGLCAYLTVTRALFLRFPGIRR